MKRRKKLLAKIFIYMVLSVLSVFILIPFILMILGSFREHVNIILKGALALPEKWSLEHYFIVLYKYNFKSYFISTIIVTLPTVIVSLLFALMSSFALAYMEFPLKKLATILTTVVGIMIATPFIMIPLYQLIDYLGLINNYLAPILPQIAMSACFGTLVLRSFFLGLPRELIEASLVDGATSWQVLWKIMAPIAKPAIFTSAALTTVWTWNAYLLPLILLHDPSKVTLPVGLIFFQGQYTTNVPLMLTGTTITSVPMIVFYLIFQKHLVKGLSQGILD